MTTTELVQQAQAGNDEAMERLLELWRPRLVRRANALVRGEDTAQDIVQETLVKVFRNLGSLANPAAFASWAYMILSRAGIEYFRREARHSTADVEVDDALWLTGAVSSESAADANVEMEQCLGHLKHEDTELILLHYWGGHELKDIACVYGIATGAAKTRLFRARGQLGLLLCEA